MDPTTWPVWLVLLLAALAIWGMGIMLGCVLGSTWREQHPHPLDRVTDIEDTVPRQYGRHAK